MNLDYLFTYTNGLGIKIDQNDFLFQFQSHPNYPSLLAISDTLDFKNIRHFAAEVGIEEVNQLPSNFIANVELVANSPEFILCQRQGDSFRLLVDGTWKDHSSIEFEKIFRNVVLVLEPPSENKANEKKGLPWINIVSIALVSSLILSLGSLPLWGSCFLTVALFGLVISYHAFMKELGLENLITKSICSLGKRTTCDSPVLSLDRIKIFNDLGLGALSFAFFASQFCVGIELSVNDGWANFERLIPIFVVPGIVVALGSIGYQIFIKKSICPVCMLINLTVFLQALIASSYVGQLSLARFELFNLLFVNVLAITAGIVYFKNTTIANRSLSVQLARLNHKRRDFDTFNLVLQSRGKIFQSNGDPTGFILGNPSSKLRLTVVSSLSCSACKDFHQELMKILEVYESKVAIELKLLYHKDRHEESAQTTHFALYQNYQTQTHTEFMRSISVWYENKSAEPFKNTVIKFEASEIENFYDQEVEWARKNGIHFTPAVFINGHAFPMSQYESSDLIFFIGEMLEHID